MSPVGHFSDVAECPTGVRDAPSGRRGIGNSAASASRRAVPVIQCSFITDMAGR